MTAPCILIIDDEAGVRKILSKVLKKEGYKVLTAANGKKAVETVKGGKVDLTLVDLKMPGIGGMETIRRIRNSDSSVINIIITGYGEMKSVKEATDLGVFDYITKPFDLKYIKALIRHLLIDTRVRPLLFSEGLEKVFTGELTQNEAIRHKLNFIKKDVITRTENLGKTGRDLDKQMASLYSSFYEFILYGVRDVVTSTYFIVIVLSILIGIAFSYMGTTAAKGRLQPGLSSEQDIIPGREATLDDFYEKLDKIEYWLKIDAEKNAESEQ